IAHGAFGAGLRLLPRDSPQTIERRRMPFAAGIFLDQVESFDRRVKFRAVGISQQHKLAPSLPVALRLLADHPRVNFSRSFRAGSVQLDQPLELPYAVINVDNVIADLQVAEIRKERRGV